MKSGCGMGWMLVLFLCAPVSAKDEDAYVTFRTSPTATVSHENGTDQSEQRVSIHFVDGSARVALSRPGYLKQTVMFQKSDLSENGEYPAQGRVILQPEHFWVPWLDWASQNKAFFLAGLLLAPTLALLTLAGWRRSRARSRTMQKFEASRDLHDSLAMQVVGGFMLVESLGSGGMATVYRGLPVADLDEKKAVAVKVLGREMVDDQEFRERFRREVNAYRKLSHPNIVKIYDWGELDSGLIYIALELIQGQTVRAHASNLSAAEIYQLLESLASALAHAHERGIIHRDLKPENLMLTDQGQLRVMDFGLARHEGAERLTRTDVIMGTPAYMAPEQLGASQADARLDQYAFGVICYELLCCRLPYTCLSGMGLFGDILSGNLIPIRRQNAALSQSLETVLQRILSKEPSARYATIQEAWEALRPHMPGKP